MPRWTKEEDEFITTNYGKISRKELTKTIRRRIGTISQRAYHLGVNTQRITKPTPIIKGETAIISLTSRKYPGLVAVIDVADLDKVANHGWWPRKGKRDGKFYAITEIDKRSVLMHILITGHTDGIDHKDGDGLNNRRSNLRTANNGQNKANSPKYRTTNRRQPTSKYKGVFYDTKYKKYRTRCRNKHIGYYTTEREAAIAYDRAARREFGEFAHLNFPEEEPQCNT